MMTGVEPVFVFAGAGALQFVEASQDIIVAVMSQALALVFHGTLQMLNSWNQMLLFGQIVSESVRQGPRRVMCVSNCMITGTMMVHCSGWRG